MNYFQELFDCKNRRKVQEDQYIIVSDVQNSTEAIENGHYKAVNTAGSLCLIALGQFLNTMRFPFIFGGDGMTAIMPSLSDQKLNELKAICASIQFDIQQIFQLHLRIAIFPISLFYKENLWLEVGDFEINRHYIQSFLIGNVLEKAEYELKNSQSIFHVGPHNLSPQIHANYSGFSCRWNDIPSHFGETIALIIRHNGNQQRQKDFWDEVQTILGENAHPLLEKNMTMAPLFRATKQEGQWTQRHKKISVALKLKILGIYAFILVWFCQKFNIQMHYHWMDLSQVKTLNVLNADYKKYDGTFKLILAVSTEQRKLITKYLDQRSNEIDYGIHVSNRAHMTCAVHIESEVEVHFIDAADGGYALAAKMLKAKLQAQGIE